MITQKTMNEPNELDIFDALITGSDTKTTYQNEIDNKVMRNIEEEGHKQRNKNVITKLIPSIIHSKL
jgi:hypothetical protein